MRTLALAPLVLCAFACDGGRAIPVPGPSGSGRADGGPGAGDASTRDAAVLMAPPMGLALEVVGTLWGGGDGNAPLTVVIALANGAGAAPATLAPSSFTLTTDHGLVISAATPPATPNACRDGVAVAAGASASCLLLFDVPTADLPQRVDYASGDRRADAAVEACSAAAPMGVCPAGRGCDRGTCEAPCSPGLFCTGDTECREGACVGPCSATEPSGYCAAGACHNGQCDTSCRGLAVNTDCVSCIQTSCQASSPNCASFEGCFGCALQQDTCTCAQETACVECPGFDAFATCLANNCPACLR